MKIKIVSKPITTNKIVLKPFIIKFKIKNLL